MKTITFALFGLASLISTCHGAPSPDEVEHPVAQKLDIPSEWLSFLEHITVTERIEEIYQVGTHYTTATRDEIMNIASNFVTAVAAAASASSSVPHQLTITGVQPVQTRIPAVEPPINAGRPQQGNAPPAEISMRPGRPGRNRGPAGIPFRGGRPGDGRPPGEGMPFIPDRPEGERFPPVQPPVVPGRPEGERPQFVQPPIAPGRPEGGRLQPVQPLVAPGRPEGERFPPVQPPVVPGRPGGERPQPGEPPIVPGRPEGERPQFVQPPSAPNRPEGERFPPVQPPIAPGRPEGNRLPGIQPSSGIVGPEENGAPPVNLPPAAGRLDGNSPGGNRASPAEPPMRSGEPEGSRASIRRATFTVSNEVYHSAVIASETVNSAKITNVPKVTSAANQAPKSSVPYLPDADLPSASASSNTSHAKTGANVNKKLDYNLQVHDPSSLGVDSVSQAAGYLHVGPDKEDHLFFWFFESRNDPKNDPVVLWLNGGPGCSSLEGMMFENGPATVDSNLKVIKNQFSWNSKANVIFLDQPVNTGFSYSQNRIDTTNKAAVDVVQFLTLFFEQFPQYAENKFHIAGESYAGHYIPAIANRILSTGNNLNFNLSSVLIGNGLVDPLTQYQYYQPMACGGGGVPAVLSQFDCNYMSDSINACRNQIQQCYNDPSNAQVCSRATIVCENSQMGAFERTGLNVYDMRVQCDPNTNGLCYAGENYVSQYFNQDVVKKTLGIDSTLRYQGCNNQINSAFLNTGDWMQPYVQNVPAILDKNLPVLIYAGDKDFICNWLGNQAWTKVVNWQGRQQFSQAPIKQWNTKAGHVGDITNYQGFSFLRVFDAGHMVPHDQPRSSLSMLNQWLAGDYAFASQQY